MARTFLFTTRDDRAGVVRVMRPRDARPCLEISREAMIERPRTLAVVTEELWSPREWRRNMPTWGPHGAGLVAEIQGRIAGSLTVQRSARPVRRHTAMLGIVVASWARGIGVGRALMDAVEGWGREFGVARLTLEVFAHNDRARRLYESLGYEQEGVDRRAVRFPEGDVDAVRMAKFLA